jgi:hypothetical protein
MRKDQIVVGKAYVNEDAGIIREVIEELDEHCVSCNTFELATGVFIPTRHRICHKGQLARWAQREASAPEAALIHPFQPAAEFDGWISGRLNSVKLEDARTALDADPGPHMYAPGK